MKVLTKILLCAWVLWSVPRDGQKLTVMSDPRAEFSTLALCLSAREKIWDKEGMDGDFGLRCLPVGTTPWGKQS